MINLIKNYLKENKINIKNNVLYMPYKYRADKEILTHNKILNVNILELFDIKKIISENNTDYSNHVLINSLDYTMYRSRGCENMASFDNYFDNNNNIVIHHNYFILHFVSHLYYNKQKLDKIELITTTSRNKDLITYYANKKTHKSNVLKVINKRINDEFLSYLQTIDLILNE